MSSLKNVTLIKVCLSLLKYGFCISIANVQQLPVHVNLFTLDEEGD